MVNDNRKKMDFEIEAYVKKAQQGDTDSFAYIYDVYIDRIYRYVFFRVKQDDALDLTESIFLKVWENIKSYQVGKNYFTAWIFRIAHNVVVDYYRQSKDVDELDVNLPDLKKDTNPVLSVERSIGKLHLRDAISKLKKDYQDIILFKYIDELSNREIAKIMNRSEGSLRLLKFRALKALRKIFDEMGIKY